MFDSSQLQKIFIYCFTYSSEKFCEHKIIMVSFLCEDNEAQIDKINNFIKSHDQKEQN